MNFTMRDSDITCTITATVYLASNVVSAPYLETKVQVAVSHPLPRILTTRTLQHSPLQTVRRRRKSEGKRSPRMKEQPSILCMKTVPMESTSQYISLKSLINLEACKSTILNLTLLFPTLNETRTPLCYQHFLSTG